MGVVGTAKLDLLVLEVSCVDLVSLQSEEDGGYMISFADFNSRISDSETIEDIHIWRSQIIHRPKAAFTGRRPHSLLLPVCAQEICELFGGFL